MSIARIPDTGAGREEQGPRPKLAVPQIEAARKARANGTSSAQLARVYRVSHRTMQRYLSRPVDPVADVVVEVIREASEEYALELSRTQVDDIGRAIMRRLRSRGLAAARPD